MFQRLKEFGLRANHSKCKFFKNAVSYCGHIIDAEGLHKSPDKVAAVLNVPQPTNVSQLRSFIGLVNYYHRFLPNLSTKLYPLKQLLQKEKEWQWTEQCEEAFQEAKKALASEEVLTHYNPALEIHLACVPHHMALEL